MMAGAVESGAVCELSSKHYSHAEGRQVYAVLLAMRITVGCIGFGLTMFYGSDLSESLLAQASLGFCQAV